MDFRDGLEELVRIGIGDWKGRIASTYLIPDQRISEYPYLEDRALYLIR
jgi:hypothetical protein